NGDKESAPSAETQTTGPEVADGYTLRKDPEGFRVAVAEGWTRTGKNGSGQVVYAKGDFELIVVPGRDSAAEYGSDPMAYQRDDERELQPYRDSSWATSTGLKSIEVGGRSMADGQFTWSGSRGDLYVRSLTTLIDGRYHVVQVRGPERARDAVTRHFEQAAATYQAAGWRTGRRTRRPRTPLPAFWLPRGSLRDNNQCAVSLASRRFPGWPYVLTLTLSRPLRGNVNQMQGQLVAGRYRLGESIGNGGMGRVWRAPDEVLHRSGAVQAVNAALYVSDSEPAVLLARTRAEARAAARINHSAVVTVHDVLEHDGRPWIVMELVEGRSLADAVKEQGRVEPQEAARIGLWVLRALGAAHRAGVLHRDVKPGNVLLGRDGRVLLTDFGIAQIEGDTAIT